jgi:hypothetical protein
VVLVAQPRELEDASGDRDGVFRDGDVVRH